MRTKPLRLAFLAIVASLWAGVCHARTGDLPAGISAVPPASFIQDDAGLYSRDPEGLRRISERLRDLKARQGYRIYVLTKSVILDTNAASLAARLQPLWLPDGNGLIVVYEADSGVFGISPPENNEVAVENPKGAHIPPYVASEIFENIRKELGTGPKGSVAPAELLDRMTTLLVRECDGYFSKGPKSAEEPVARKLLTGAVIAIVLLGLLLWFGTRKLETVEERNSRTFYFPEVPDKQRLGAPFGATVSVRRFSGRDPGEPV